MGQIFDATAYDIETKESYTMDADKFHANCYSHSGAVSAMHYLLRQKPYRVMWGGGYVLLDDFLGYVSREEDLMGISTYLNQDCFEMNNENLHEKAYFDKVQRIESYSKEWTNLDGTLDKALKFFKYKKQGLCDIQVILLITHRSLLLILNHTGKNQLHTMDGVTQVVLILCLHLQKQAVV